MPFIFRSLGKSFSWWSNATMGNLRFTLSLR